MNVPRWVLETLAGEPARGNLEEIKKRIEELKKHPPAGLTAQQKEEEEFSDEDLLVLDFFIWCVSEFNRMAIGDSVRSLLELDNELNLSIFSRVMLTLIHTAFSTIHNRFRVELGDASVLNLNTDRLRQEYILLMGMVLERENFLERFLVELTRRGLRMPIPAASRWASGLPFDPFGHKGGNKIL